jgi:hypothetical protein
MIEGICPKCGYCYVGWALKFPRNQMCSNCGAALQIYLDGNRISEGYSPFTAEKHIVDLPKGSSPKINIEKSGKTEDTHPRS